MAVKSPWWKKWMCYLFCEWFTKPIFKKRLCVCAYDVLRVKRKVKRELKGKDGGFRFLRVPKIIAFIGLDGSGKSTQAKNVINFLKENGFKTSYLHLPSAVPLNLVKKVKSIKVNKRSKKANAFRSFLRQMAFLTGIKWVFLTKILPNMLRRRIIVSDRWFYDELVHLSYLKMCSFPKLYRRLIPKPGFLIYLDVDAKTAEKRKPEHDSDYFIIKHKLYGMLLKKVKAEKVKAMNLKKTKTDVEKALLKKLEYTLD